MVGVPFAYYSPSGSDLAIDLEYWGEGMDGKYKDGADVQLLRFVISYKNKRLINESYCTLISTSVPKDDLDKILKMMYEDIAPVIDSPECLEIICKELSWIDETCLEVQLENSATKKGRGGPKVCRTPSSDY